MFYLFLLILLINTNRTYQNVLTIIGDKNIKYRNAIIPQSISKLSINGPFYCQIKWIDNNNNKQTIDIYTDNNIHPYVIIKIEKNTLQLMIQSEVNFKYTVMDIYFNLRPVIQEIFLAGISTIYSVNMLNMNNLLTLRTEDTTHLFLSLNVSNLNALFLSAGTTELTGHVKNTALIKYHGIGDVDASKLFCKIVDINANGLGTVWIKGTNECFIKAKGVSIIRYDCYNAKYIQLSDLAKIIPI